MPPAPDSSRPGKTCLQPTEQSRILRSRHHLWFSEDMFARHANPDVRALRTLRCSVVMAYAAAHASIHGTVSESLCKQGLYLPLTVPKQAIIREVMAMHPSHRGCQHPLTFTMVSVFDLS